MTVGVEIKLNPLVLARFAAAMRRTPERLAKEISVAFDQHAFIFEGYARARLFAGRPHLIGRTGRLAKTIGHVTAKNPTKINDVHVRIFAGGHDAIYGRIQEFGGVIRPVRAKYLTIPIADNLTAGGVPRYKSARELFEQRGEDLVIFRSKAGNLLIGLIEGRDRGIQFEGGLATGKTGGTLKLLWVLKKSVKIPARFGFVAAFKSKEMENDRRARISAGIGRALRSSGAGAGAGA